MSTLHALLIGINDYPEPVPVLRGCLNDVQRLNAYLESYCRTFGVAYRPLILCDQQATRQGVIDAFERHFRVAEKDDCCLFQYSGHGARWPAPEAFWHLEPDRMMESLVCYDSRQPGGFDLMDKELSYLIWQASQNTERPFVSILDSCHSGDMRSVEDKKHDLQLEVVGVRGLKGALAGGLPLERFVGMMHYRQSADGQLAPPYGRRVHFGAARNDEYAKEVVAGGRPFGIFTWCLVEALSHTGPFISYADLLDRVRTRIRQNVKAQSAQMYATYTDDRNLGFLFSRLDARRPSFLVSWDKNAQRWYVDAGAVHGISAGDAGSRTLLELEEDKQQLAVDCTEPNRAAVSGMEGRDTRRSYVAALKRRAVPKLALAFARDNDPAGEARLRELIEQQAPDTFRLENTPAASNYRLHAAAGAYFLTGLHDDRPLFKKISGHYSDTAATTFLECLDKVAAWQQLLDRQNPETEIAGSEIALELYRLTEARSIPAMNDDSPVEAVDWQNGPSEFRYFRDDAASPVLPAFQLKIKNNSSRPLWVGVLYLDGLFGIENGLLPKVALGPGEETWVSWTNNGYPTRTVPLQIDDPELDAVDEYMKVLISTDELDTGRFNQKRLEPDVRRERTRGPVHFSTRQQPEQEDWTAKTVRVRVRRGF